MRRSLPFGLMGPRGGDRKLDTEQIPTGEGSLWVQDHAGDYYLTILQRLHESLRPKTYLEIGTSEIGILDGIFLPI